MLRMISSDVYRLKKSKTPLAVFVGLLITILLVAISFKFLTVSFTEDDMSTVIPGPTNGGEFLQLIFGQLSTMIPFLILPFILSVFGADYVQGTFRNLLSSNTSRTKIFIAKFFGTILTTIAVLIVYVLLSSLIAALFFGFDGFGDVIGKVMMGLLMQFPVHLAFLGIGYVLLIFTKRTSATIAIYIAGTMVLNMVLSILSIVKPDWDWLSLLDIVQMPGRLANYTAMTSREIIISLAFVGFIFVSTVVSGLIKYRKVDFDFN